MLKSALLWIFTALFTIGIAYYQRTTGPTYPANGSVQIENHTIDYELLRSHGGTTDAPISIEVPDKSFNGYIEYVRYKSGDEPIKIPMKYEEGQLVAYLPNQPPAGKLAYDAYLEKDEQSFKLNDERTVIRFKGAVPKIILIPHIIFMFIAMLFSTRTGIEALIRGKRLYAYTLTTLVTLFVGGLILGPIVQEYAFGDFWTGWPFGQDLTDNKTLVAFIFWLIAFFKVRKNKKHRTWVIIAAVVLLAVYLIPHSMFGSELDYSTGQVETGKN
ncbi:MAG TPA: hypothetical protein VJ939_09255 [Bacteroidales bacterium]|nr:hypothetical protein [Bacteroidales bacterium]